MKHLSVLLVTWERKVNAIIEARNLHTLIMDDLIGYLKTYELKIHQEHRMDGP